MWKREGEWLVFRGVLKEMIGKSIVGCGTEIGVGNWELGYLVWVTHFHR